MVSMNAVLLISFLLWSVGVAGCSSAATRW